MKTYALAAGDFVGDREIERIVRIGGPTRIAFNYTDGTTEMFPPGYDVPDARVGERRRKDYPNPVHEFWLFKNNHEEGWTARAYTHEGDGIVREVAVQGGPTPAEALAATLEHMTLNDIPIRED